MIIEVNHEGRCYTISAADPKNWILKVVETRDVTSRKTGKTTKDKEVENIIGYYSTPENAISRLATDILANTGFVVTLEKVSGEIKALRESLVLEYKNAT